MGKKKTASTGAASEAGGGVATAERDYRMVTIQVPVCIDKLETYRHRQFIRVNLPNRRKHRKCSIAADSVLDGMDRANIRVRMDDRDVGPRYPAEAIRWMLEQIADKVESGDFSD